MCMSYTIVRMIFLPFDIVIVCLFHDTIVRLQLRRRHRSENCAIHGDKKSAMQKYWLNAIAKAAIRIPQIESID